MSQQKDLRILAIEDDRTVLKIYEKLFSEKGYQLQAAQTGAEALCRIEQENFDLICLDLKLPDMDGLLLIDKLKDKLEWVPVIIVTANPSLDSSIGAINAGIVTEYIVKPFDSRELILTVKKAVEKARLTIANKRLLKKVETTNQALLERVDQLEHFAKEATTLRIEINRLKGYVRELETRLGITGKG